MPIEYTVIMYGCKFKCGRAHSRYRETIVKHEKICWFNPKNKTCKTCKHEKYYTDEDDMDIWKERECLIGNISDDELEELRFDNGIKPKEHCEKWEPKETNKQEE